MNERDEQLYSDPAKARGSGGVKEQNRVSVLKALLIDGVSARVDIARNTGLSQSTVTRVVNDLLRENLVLEKGSSLTGSRGFPPGILSFNGELAYIVGIDIGESFIRYKLTNLLGEHRGSDRVATSALSGGNTTYRQLIGGYSELLGQSGIPPERVWGVCVGIPGVVDPRSGNVTVPDIRDWWKYPLGAKLSEDIHAQVIVENASNCCIVGEHTYGCAKNVENAVFINLRAGIGGGVLLEGKLFRGNNNAAGELGFILPSADCEGLPDKRRGAMERTAGIYAIMGALNEYYSGAVDADNIPFMQSICQLAAEGEQQHLRVIERNLRYYSQLAVNAVAVLNPDMIVIGGDVMPVGDMIVNRVEQDVERFTPYPPKIALSSLGSNAALMGALKLASEHALLRLGISP